MEKIILNLQTLNSYHLFRYNDNIFTQGVSGEMSKLILILSYFSLSYIWHDQCCTMSWLPPPASVSQLMMSWDELATAMIAVIVSTLTNCRALTAIQHLFQVHKIISDDSQAYFNIVLTYPEYRLSLIVEKNIYYSTRICL